jgi:phage-related protein
MAIDHKAHLKPLRWIGDSYRRYVEFPRQVKQDIGLAMMVAQYGGKAESAKPWKGLGSGVMEVVDSFDGNAYRAIYTVRFADSVYVLHAFQKKSKRGISTPQRDVNLVKARLVAALHDYETRSKGEST